MDIFSSLTVIILLFLWLYILDRISSKSPILAIVVALICILTVIYFTQNRFVYMNVLPLIAYQAKDNHPGWRHPEQVALTHQDVQIKTQDNLILRGWLFSKPQNKRIILFFHQNACNLGVRLKYMKLLHERLKADLMIVAYRGYSDSEGVPTERGLQLDAQAILSYAVEYKEREGKVLYVLGRSMGGAVSIYTSTLEQHREHVRGYILENTFTSFLDVFDFIIPVPFSWILQPLVLNQWPSVQRISKMTQPVLFIRSVLDETIPTQQMQRLYNAAVRSKFREEFVIEKGMHMVWWQLDQEGYFGALANFFDKAESI